MTKMGYASFIIMLALSVFVLAGCGGTSNTTVPQKPVSTRAAVTSGTGREQPVPPSNNAQASDIPDTQVFVTYTSPAGNYRLDVPEGWARTTSGADANFVNNLNALQVTLTNTTSPTVDSVRAGQAVTLEQSGRAVRDVQVKAAQLSAGPAVLMVYSSNSDPNAVTGKQVRLENNSYLFFKNGKLATLTLSAPVGADNADQWARISRSFRWV